MRSRFNKRITRYKPKVEPEFLIKISITILLYIILFFGLSSIFKRSIAIKEFENSMNEFSAKNSETIFEISEINFYSSAAAETNLQKTGLDISRIY